jgi:1-acyl-sn-glycerol-3-phosphate acyltransferase
MVGLRTEVRGTPPTGEVLIASKHQSFLDIIMIVSVVPRPKFIMKSNSNGPPFSAGTRCASAASRGPGQARRGHSPDGRRCAERHADARAADHLSSGHTRRAGRAKSYKVGTAILYKETGQTCVPAATNVGVFWPRTGIYRKPGVAVVEFLPPIEQGLSQKAFMARLEA